MAVRQWYGFTKEEAEFLQELVDAEWHRQDIGHPLAGWIVTQKGRDRRDLCQRVKAALREGE